MAIILVAAIALAAYTVYGAIWRLYLSPIAHIPGPRIAAVTLWYEFYYDVILGGQYTFKIIKLHKKYGPILRISPWEVHIGDPDYYHTLYCSSASGQKRDKNPWFTKSFGLNLSTSGTPEHDLHKLRRGAIGVFFSMTSVRKLEGLIRDRALALLKRFDEFKESGEVLMASWAFSAFTNDIVMSYSFGRSDNRIEAPDFDPSYRDASFFGSTMENPLKHAPWINQLFLAIPDSIARLLHPAMTEFIRQKRLKDCPQNTQKQIESIIAGINDSDKSISHATIFHQILHSKLPPHEKTLPRLTDEAQVMMMAGTLTVAWTLEVIMYWLCRQPDTLKALKTELKTVMPEINTVVPLTTLETLPYLNAVIKEGLRLTYGVSCRLMRSCPDAEMKYTDPETGKEWIIPAGVPVGLSSVQIHHDKSIFPDSKHFYPERWLKAAAEGKNLDKYLISFTAGARICLGRDLAYAELYINLSNVWRRWGSTGYRDESDVGVFELYETTLRDVEIEADHFLPIQQPGTKGIRVRCYT
ncbi:cytochrome P450 [Tothia fuscella]|uniref:Cytochrome P450 n=1 Tax=Tothia fuscella TaxID=1048955 RepID=A0A9P4U3J1_9PEZI|nr:cytochrome P450 [Tothia fuscella]